MNTPSSLFDTYLHVRDGGRADPVTLSETFWQEVVGGQRPELDEGRLMTAFAFAEPWANWERHPAGDELVMLLSGSVELVLAEAGRERTVRLVTPGTYVLVPPNVWHTARPAEPTTMLFLTPGAGTEHRPVAVGIPAADPTSAPLSAASDRTAC